MSEPVFTSALAHRHDLERQPGWTQSIAVGQREYLDAIECELKISHPGRMIEGDGKYLFLREEPNAYLPKKMPEKFGLS